MANTISAQERALTDVFNDKFSFVVPDYQRPYAWEWEQAQDLFDDVCDASADATDLDHVESLDPYFLGCTVVVKSDNNPRSEVVDGQQRLTTLTMMFCALRDVMESEGHTLWSGNVNAMVQRAAAPAAGLKAAERVRLRPEDVEFFRERVLNPGALVPGVEYPAPKGETQLRLLRNSRGLLELVRELSRERREILVRFLATKCYLVIVQTADTSSAVRIFGVLHTRGLDLSAADIIKAEIARKIGDADRAHQMSVWQEKEEGIGRDNFGLLFSHIYTIRARERSRKSLEDVFVRDVLDGGGDCANFVKRTLAPYADDFEKLVSSGFSHSTEETKLLRSLRQVDNTDWIPPALHFVRHRGNSPEPLTEFLRNLERLAYSMFITRTHRDRRVKRYVEILNDIDNEKESDFGGSIQLSTDEQNEFLSVLKGDVDWKWARQVLLRLDGLFADGVAEYQHAKVSVEHVLPQRPRDDSQWLDWFPTEEIRQNWTWKLANLVLLSRSKNSEANNKDFDAKKNTYFVEGNSTSFKLTLDVINEQEWTQPVLRRRQDKLVDMLAKEWRLTE